MVDWKEKGKGAAVFAVLCFIILILGDGVLCQFRVIFGMPCPGCGMTRAFLSVLHGQWQQAFFYHPLWPLVILLAGLYFVSIVLGKDWFRNQTFLIIIFVIFVGTYLIRMILLFPDTPPLDFNPDGVFPKMIRSFFCQEGLA